ncbi:MAG: HPF/RaiA family ribosome-associated protein [Pirellulales bacterium]|nr:HPF/RaiA family ribosome-associated protein [Pirellulales bacterium]
MKLPLQVSFRGMKRVAAIEAMVREKAARLDRFAQDIMSCRVVVEPAGKHHVHGNQYEVHIDITLPDEEIVITREPAEHKEHRNIQTALRDAFDAARRRLEDFVRRRRLAVKTHTPLPHGRVTRLVPDEDYGILTTPDGREVYFHRASVLHNAFDKLQIGTEVAFVEELGDNGPQASTVRRVGRHNRL